MVAPALAALLAPLLKNGLGLVGDALLAKGQDWVEKKLNVKLAPDMTPEQILALKQAELEHEEELLKVALEHRKLDIAEVEAYLRDTQSSRQMQADALKQSDVFAKRFVYYFAIFWSISVVLYVGGITFFGIPEENVRFADTVLGFMLGTLIAQIFNFFYGSSRSSQQKDNVIGEVVKHVTGK